MGSTRLAALALLAACAGAPSPTRQPEPPERPPTSSHPVTAVEDSVATAQPLAAAAQPLAVAAQPVAAGPFTNGPWTVRIVSTAPGPILYEQRSATGPATITFPVQGTFRTLRIEGLVPGAGRPVDSLSGPRLDADGSVYVTAHWSGNPDQANGIGAGIYRVVANGLVSVVDCFQRAPGQSIRFNEIGLPIVDHGEIAFWAGRGGSEWSGVYLWSGGRITTVADSSGTVAGTGTPALSEGMVAFVGEPRGAPGTRGLYVWSRADPVPRRIAGDGDPLPRPAATGARIADIVIADPVVSRGRVFFVARGREQQPATALVLEWDGRTLRTVLAPEALGPPGTVYIQSRIAVSGDSVAVTATREGRSGVIVLRGTTPEVVIEEGVARGFYLTDDPFTGTELDLTGMVGDAIVTLHATRR